MKRTRSATNVLPFNPLAKKVLGGAIAEAILSTRVYPLKDSFPLNGAGVYAIYYAGDLPMYAKLADQNRGDQFKWPIYVGQSLPSGGRRGIELNENEAKLRQRLMKHCRSINTSGLDIDDFYYRALVMDDAFIRLAETSLLVLYKPIWNNYVDGFGNNAPGARRVGSKKSRWDTLHSGREQAASHGSRNESRDVIIQEIQTELNNTNFDLPDLLIHAQDQSVHQSVFSADLVAESGSADTNEVSE